MERLIQDVRHALRSLARSPVFTLTTISTLGLGIGASTALFSVTDTLLLRPLPLHEPGRLVQIRLYSEANTSLSQFSYPQFSELRARTRRLSGLTAATAYEFSLRGRGPTEVLPGAFVSANYFQVLGVHPAVGRFFTSEEDVPDTSPVAVLSHRIWQRRFGGDPAILGQTVSLNGKSLTVIGVAPVGFTTERVGSVPPDIWVPLATYPLFESEAMLQGAGFMLTLVGRLREGTGAESATAELGHILRQSEHDNVFGMPIDGVKLRSLDPIAAPLEDQVVSYLALLTIATGLVLFVAGVNVAAMLLARSMARRSEIGIRMAIGASRGRIVRQLLTEGVVVFLLGGAAGVVLALWLTEGLSAFPWPIPAHLDLSVDTRVLAFALALALTTGVVFSLAPALQSTRPHLLSALRGGAADPRPARLRGSLVVLQVALSLLLLVGAGLFLRALQRAWNIDPGFDPYGASVVTLDLSIHGYDDSAAEQFLGQILGRARALPGVESASLSSGIPFGGLGGKAIEPEGVQPPPEQPFIFASYNAISPAYFRTLEIPPLQGRVLTEADETGGQRVAVINRAMAEKFWPGESPIGKRLESGANPVYVVGVVGDTRARTLEADPEPVMYLPLFSEEFRSRAAVALYVRTRGNPEPVFAALRNEVRAMDPNLPPLTFTPLSELIGMSLLPQRIGAGLMGAFGLFGLLLAAFGLYGVIAYSVVRRAREIGVRIALGADHREVVRLIVRQGVAITTGGIGLGLAVAVVGTRVLASLLYGINPLNPLVYTAVALLLAAVALLASYLPARRAARVDPIVALRAE
jgi:putative ABC transport system permease protein